MRSSPSVDRTRSPITTHTIAGLYTSQQALSIPGSGMTDSKGAPCQQRMYPEAPNRYLLIFGYMTREVFTPQTSQQPPLLAHSLHACQKTGKGGQPSWSAHCINYDLSDALW